MWRQMNALSWKAVSGKLWVWENRESGCSEGNGLWKAKSVNQAVKINESLRELFKLESSIGEILSPDTSWILIVNTFPLH